VQKADAHDIKEVSNTAALKEAIQFIISSREYRIKKWTGGTNTQKGFKSHPSTPYIQEQSSNDWLKHVRAMEEKCVPKSKCLYHSFGRGREEHRESGEMKNKRKYNRNSKVELPKRYRKNKK